MSDSTAPADSYDTNLPPELTPDDLQGIQASLNSQSTAETAHATTATVQADGVTGGFWPYLDAHPMLQGALGLVGVILLAVVAHLIVQRLILRIVKLMARRLPTWWHQVLIDEGVFHRLAWLVPVFIIDRGAQWVPHLSDDLRLFVFRLAMAMAILIVVLAFSALLTAINAIYSRYPIARGRPIKSYMQVVKLLAIIAAAIMMVTALLGLEPWWFVSGVGAMMAVILLIFRDTLLGLVAGIQLVNNDLIRVGDWIEMPQFNADGDVVDISLNVVRVINWDKTVTVIPTHKFLDHAFKNWRAMHEQGGRRIKRSLAVDVSTIRFLTQEEIARFSRFKLLKDYIQAKSNEIAAYNREHCPADAADVIANARHLTNVGTFRAYITSYLRNHPLIHQKMTFLVRQLAPDSHGLPIEIYVHVSDTRWAIYEGVQADIFDHLLALVPEFGLRVYQEPSGADMAAIGKDSVSPGCVAVQGGPNLTPLGMDSGIHAAENLQVSHPPADDPASPHHP